MGTLGKSKILLTLLNLIPCLGILFYFVKFLFDDKPPPKILYFLSGQLCKKKIVHCTMVLGGLDFVLSTLTPEIYVRHLTSRFLMLLSF